MNATPTETPTYDGPGPQRPTRGAGLTHSAEEFAASELTRRLAQTPSLLPRVERLALLAEHDVHDHRSVRRARPCPGRHRASRDSDPALETNCTVAFIRLDQPSTWASSPP
jgi:hypothetical protein